MSQLVFGVRMNAPRSGCPINLTLEALGDRWSLIVIRDLMFGNRRHFRELLTRSEERIASNILADRLTRLEKAGLVSPRDDPSHKQKVIYSLTEASIALAPLLAHMVIAMPTPVVADLVRSRLQKLIDEGRSVRNRGPRSDLHLRHPHLAGLASRRRAGFSLWAT